MSAPTIDSIRLLPFLWVGWEGPWPGEPGFIRVGFTRKHAANRAFKAAAAAKELPTAPSEPGGEQ